MNDNEKLAWSVLEYEEKERSSDWFWALGIIVVSSSVTAVIYGSYFFAALLILSGVLLGFFAVKKPDVIPYELNRDGLKIRNRLYPYENIKSFWVQADPTGETNVKPILFIKSERLFMPVMAIPIDNSLAEDIHFILDSKNVTEEEMKEHPSHTIMESLGF